MDVRLGIFAVPDATDPESTVGLKAAGRNPADIERVVNVMALDGRPESWVDQLARIVTELRFSTLLVGLPDEDPVDFVRRLGQDVAPRLRELLG
jgi:hypothetical protein